RRCIPDPVANGPGRKGAGGLGLPRQAAQPGAVQRWRPQPWSGRGGRVAMSCGRLLLGGLREVDLSLKLDGVRDLQRAEESRVGLDTEASLTDCRGGPVLAGADLADVESLGLRSPCERERTDNDPASITRPRLEARRSERGFRVPVGREYLARADGYLALIPVGQRLDAACPGAHDKCSDID